MQEARAPSRERGNAMLAPACLVAGPLIWFVHFVLVYGGHTMFCAFGASGIGWFVIAATGAAALLLSAVAAMSLDALRRPGWTEVMSPGQRFQHRAAMLAVGLSALAVVWVGITATVVPACS
jgi:hypothetical protein